MHRLSSALIIAFGTFAFFAISVVFYASQVVAKVGVGVGTGKIIVDQELKPGLIYELPSLTVFNTGDVESEYTVSVAYHEQQPEMRPESAWLIFNPQTFLLKPGEAQEVNIQLNLPIKTEPGDYFAYIEGSPLVAGERGGTKVGVAAATKLYFQVVPSTTWEGIYYRVLSLLKLYHPWPQRAAYALGVVAALFLFQKFFKIQINLKKPTDE